MADSFKVIGRNILPNDCFKLYKQKQPSRKFFNTDWLSGAEYQQHEIANHYRDYKHLQKVRRIRKGGLRHKKVIFRDQVCDYRDVFAVNRIDFPPTTRDFPLQGNPANRRLQPLGTVYDNTLRRILTANTLSELGFLTKRQENLYKFRKGLKPHQGVSINCSNYSKHSSSKTACNRARAKQKRHSLGHIISDTLERIHCHNHLVCDRPTIAVVHDKALSLDALYEGALRNEKDKYFLQLASECYSEGFLAHVKYLESIGERNAINNQISKQSKQRHFPKSTTDSRPQSVESNVSSGNSVEDLSNSYGVKGFISVVKRILKTRRYVQNPCNYGNDVHGVIQQDWKIRVNITRSSSPESLHSSRSSIHEPHDNITLNHCIMSDTLNEGQTKQISAGNESAVKRQNFHDLIENLNNLEIGKVGSLPKIVLTDFSTSNIATDSVTPLRAAKSHENVITKQQSLEVDLPSLSDYNSEARPP